MSNTEMTRREQNRLRKRYPYGAVAAMLTAVIVTLIGVFRQFEPQVILVRSATAAIVIGAVVSIGVGLLRLTTTQTR